jgi:predicted esterase
VSQSRTACHPHSHHLRVQRTARYYTLGGESGAPKTIWFVLHGYGQLAGQFVRYFADLADADTLIVAPEAMNRFYLVSVDKAPARERPVGATWMTREDRESEIGDYVEYLEALYEDLAAKNGSESAVAVNVVGFSQGAATATRWVTNGKARIDRLILWGGLLPPEDLDRGKALRSVPLTLVVGSRDHYVTDDMVANEKARLDGLGIPYQLVRFEGGHVISRSAFAQLRFATGASDR